jgi:hypothetical protein
VECADAHPTEGLAVESNEEAFEVVVEFLATVNSSRSKADGGCRKRRPWVSDPRA